MQDVTRMVETPWIRTHTCGALGADHDGRDVRLSGWVAKRRDHGGLIFIDLRDRYGVTQLVFDPAQSTNAASVEAAHKVRSEFVISVKGKVRRRPGDMVNPKLSTGEIEVVVDELHILSAAKTTPFQIDDSTDASETLRLKYRYLDMRRPSLQQKLIARHKMLQVTRNFLSEQNFLEIETPILFKSTPEGARDYLVPSRVSPGNFYALVQSPQIMKQLLMVAGFDRYFQIARCFRDEDLRADRQPEFSQIDIEMTFTNREIIYALIEGLMKKIFHDTAGVAITVPFPRMTWQEAMDQYGVDKPDTRFDLRLKDATEIFRGTGFQAFQNVISQGGLVRGIRVDAATLGTKQYSRKDLDDLTQFAQQFGAKGMAWIKVEAGGAAGAGGAGGTGGATGAGGALASPIASAPPVTLTSPVTKFFSDAEKARLVKEWRLSEGDLVLLVADANKSTVWAALGNLRCHLARQLGLIDDSLYNFLWVTDFPLLEYDPEAKRWAACHHPFTSPSPEDEEKFLRGEDLGSIKAAAYDCVLNGYEVGGGSIRIFRQEVQQAMFRALGMSDAEVEQKFGFFVEALQYGTPPHGGIAMGVDRLVMLLTGTDAIREVMSFPKTQKATDLMSECPSPVAVEQLTELGVALIRKGPSGGV